MISDYLEKIQNKPRPVRVAIMWAGVAIFMTFFLILWVAMADPGQSNKNLASENQFEQQPQSFSEIKKEIPSLWQSLKASVSGLFESLDQAELKVQIEGGAGENNNNTVSPSSLP